MPVRTVEVARWFAGQRGLEGALEGDGRPLGRARDHDPGRGATGPGSARWLTVQDARRKTRAVQVSLLPLYSLKAVDACKKLRESEAVGALLAGSRWTVVFVAPDEAGGSTARAVGRPAMRCAAIRRRGLPTSFVLIPSDTRQGKVDLAQYRGRQNRRRWQRKLQRAETIITLQKKVAVTSPTGDPPKVTLASTNDGVLD